MQCLSKECFHIFCWGLHKPCPVNIATSRCLLWNERRAKRCIDECSSAGLGALLVIWLDHRSCRNGLLRSNRDFDLLAEFFIVGDLSFVAAISVQDAKGRFYPCASSGNSFALNHG